MSKKQKMIICRNCNKPISKKAKICPSCGAKNKKSIFKRIGFWLLLVVIAAIAVGIVSSNMSENNEKEREYRWPSSALVSRIPQPESKNGKINSESETYFRIDIYKTSGAQFEDYIEKCKEKGFTEEYSKYDGSYSAKNTEGYSLRLNYVESGQEMSISLNAPTVGDKNVENSVSAAPEPTETPLSEPEVTEEAAEETAVGTEEATDNTEAETTGISSEFKEAMDSYEIFMNDYCDFMIKFAESDGTDLGLLADYADYMAKYAKVAEDFADMGSDAMSTEEAAYYLDVQNRINKRLLEIAE